MHLRPVRSTRRESLSLNWLTWSKRTDGNSSSHHKYCLIHFISAQFDSSSAAVINLCSALFTWQDCRHTCTPHACFKPSPSALAVHVSTCLVHFVFNIYMSTYHTCTHVINLTVFFFFFTESGYKNLTRGQTYISVTIDKVTVQRLPCTEVSKPSLPSQQLRLLAGFWLRIWRLGSLPPSLLRLNVLPHT